MSEYSPSRSEHHEPVDKITRREVMVRIVLGATGIAGVGALLAAPKDFSFGDILDSISGNSSHEDSAPTPITGSQGYPNTQEPVKIASPVSYEKEK